MLPHPVLFDDDALEMQAARLEAQARVLRARAAQIGFEDSEMHARLRATITSLRTLSASLAR